MAKNSIVLDFRDNPELQAALGGKKAGERLTLEFEVMVKSVDTETFEADIESIAVDSEEEDTAESAEVDAESPVNAIIVVARKESGKKKKNDDSASDTSATTDTSEDDDA